ncbi:rCG44791 [Rattus norvegicus]|uniref:RCG44791 n=1 Tax=Rattus norvegicus TaxID=10116 RepID=A6I4I0_RAT|nr:rCG44791 [Rattus norvegicus]
MERLCDLKQWRQPHTRLSHEARC